MLHDKVQARRLLTRPCLALLGDDVMASVQAALGARDSSGKKLATRAELLAAFACSDFLTTTLGCSPHAVLAAARQLGGKQLTQVMKQTRRVSLGQ